MAFPRRLLGETEEIAQELHPHWLYLIGPLTALVAAIALGVGLWQADVADALSAAGGALVLVALLWFLGRLARWATTHFVITSDRLIYRHGVLSKHGIEIPLERVNTVLFRQSLWERLLRTGHVTIESAGEQGRQEFHDVRRPAAVQNEIYRRIEESHSRRRDAVAEAAVDAATSAAADDSIPAQIRELDQLRRQGLVSEDEFARKKSDLLDRM